MEFGEKIQTLRKLSGLTQEQLAEKLYISRTAVSKWESGKGYPNIESLKDIAQMFNVSIDYLLSSEEIISISTKQTKFKIERIIHFFWGLLDVLSVLFIFLPLYPCTINGFIYSVTLFSENDVSNVMKFFCSALLFSVSIIGVVEILFCFIDRCKIQRLIHVITLIIQMVSVLFFIVSRQIYLTVIIFVILIIKVTLALNNFKR